ncbi:hypothetical protein TRV_04147 [Trichophyton verrucosum HKI 0517]|uniref:Uncharacterized protein n=1 Tax=Trichophyton verrucosum (strain HKI 0517) TaxID=663202 RepID=D4DAK0_TRIVH|nr:uncharacterized protein TRV_04147 [Trichophyton verrucosum HKI 0517]EFE41131.1 hypothetical protein TRV_04147 [Trichophyton verrucosum HKI 0517]
MHVSGSGVAGWLAGEAKRLFFFFPGSSRDHEERDPEKGSRKAKTANSKSKRKAKKGRKPKKETRGKMELELETPRGLRVAREEEDSRGRLSRKRAKSKRAKRERPVGRAKDDLVGCSSAGGSRRAQEDSQRSQRVDGWLVGMVRDELGD